MPPVRKRTPRPKKTAAPSTNGHGPPKIPGFVMANDLPPENDVTEYLWETWLPYGCLSLLVGLPEAGKSSLLVRLAAAVTSGCGFQGEVGGTGSNVILCATEDSYHKTLKNRLIEAGGDTSRVILPGSADKRDTGPPLKFPRGLTDLKAAVEAARAPLVILDPFAGFVDGADLNSETAVREVLEGLNRIAQQTGSCIITTRNFNKKVTGGVLFRINGSAAFRDVPRSVLCVMPHPREADSKILFHAKSSGMLKSAPRLYQLVDRNGSAYFDLLGKADVSIDDCEDSDSSPGDRAEFRAAHELLHGMIGEAWIEAAKIYSAAQQLGIGKSKVWRARAELKVRHQRIGFGPGSHVEWGPPEGGWPEGLAHKEQPE